MPSTPLFEVSLLHALPAVPHVPVTQVPESLFYLYSKAQVEANATAYKQALEGLPSILCYAVGAAWGV